MLETQVECVARMVRNKQMGRKKISLDIEREKAKCRADLLTFLDQLQQVEQQKVLLLQAINERRGILAFLTSLEHPVGGQNV